MRHPQDTQTQWDALHTQPRFRPRYPSEYVVRFLMAHFGPEERMEKRLLDIGVGGGRHTRLACEMGFQTFGVDISEEGLRQTEQILRQEGHRASLVHADMAELPFPDDYFDAALSYGVYCYNDRAGLETAVCELYRVLRPEGAAFVMFRTDRDYRCGKGEQLEPGTFRLTISDTNEYGSVQHFPAETDIPTLFQDFARLSFERTEVTFANRTERHSDWLIQLTK